MGSPEISDITYHETEKVILNPKSGQIYVWTPWSSNVRDAIERDGSILKPTQNHLTIVICHRLSNASLKANYSDMYMQQQYGLHKKVNFSTQNLQQRDYKKEDIACIKKNVTKRQPSFINKSKSQHNLI